MNQEEIKKEDEIIEEIKEVEEAVEEKIEDIAEKAEEEIEEAVEEAKEVEEAVEEKVEEVIEEVKEVEEDVEEKVVGYIKADAFKRIVAYLIDAILAGVVGSIGVVGGLAAAAYMLLRDGFDFMQNRSLGKMALNLKPIVVETGGNCDLMTSAKRNWPLAVGYLPSIILRLLFKIPAVGWVILLMFGIPLLIYVVVEAVLIFTDKKGLRLGDKMAGTQVIEL